MSTCALLNELVIDPKEIIKLVQSRTDEKKSKKELCFACKSAVTLINNRLGAQPDRDAILGHLRYTASMLPDEFAPIVSNVVNMYGNVFIEQVLNNQICHTLELC